MIYGDIVNMAVDESKSDLDPLTIANFATPPRSVMYNRFKKWVAQAYQDLLTDRPEWFFTNERAVVTIYPRLHLSGLVVPYGGGNWEPTVGDILTGQTSGVSFTILAIHSQFEGEESDGSEITISVAYDDVVPRSGLLVNELLDVLPTEGEDFYSAAWVEGRGRYNFNELVPNLDEIKESSVSVQPAVRIATAPSPQELRPVAPANFVPWSRWLSLYDSFADTPGQPLYITQTPDGNYDFYPRPDAPYDVAFDYSQKGDPLVLWGDTPTLLPTKYHMYLVWKAVAEFADFNSNTKVFARADKHIKEYQYKLNRQYLPAPSMQLDRFDIESFDGTY